MNENEEDERRDTIETPAPLRCAVTCPECKVPGLCVDCEGYGCATCDDSGTCPECDGLGYYKPFDDWTKVPQ